MRMARKCLSTRRVAIRLVNLRISNLNKEAIFIFNTLLKIGMRVNLLIRRECSLLNSIISINFHGSNNLFLKNYHRNGKKSMEIVQVFTWQERTTESYLMKCFSYSRLYNSACSNACRPILIDPILMSICLNIISSLQN